jgi:hypothetical protein
MQLLESGFFDDAGFTHLHVAGHPEGNRDIDPDGGEAEVMAALKWKQDFANRSDASFAIATQFAFEADGVVAWAERLAAAGIEMPVHLGVAGPAKLQTLIKFAIACGVGKSLGVLQKRAKDVTKLLLPFEPTEFMADLAARKAAGQASNIERIHFFPLGGIKANAEWAMTHGGAAASPRRPPSPDTPRQPKIKGRPSLMTRTVIESKTRTTVIGFDQPFCVIGERINPTGRKILNEELERGDFSRVEAMRWHRWRPGRRCST